MLYVVNSQNHYFVVEDESLKDELAAKGCTILPDLQSMYEHVAKAGGLDVEEVEGSEYYVKEGRLIDDRGMSYDRDDEDEVSIVDVVVNFTL